MATFVSLDTVLGNLERYEVGGSRIRKTHHAALTPWPYPAGDVAYTIELFRTRPDSKFAVDPPPRPTNPSMSAGRAVS